MTNTLLTATRNGSGNGHVPAWHTGFVRMMPVIRRHARDLFRHMARPERNEAVAEVIAVALVDYVRYLEDGVSEAVDPNALAAFATRTVRNGGRACGQESSRDVLSPTAQNRRGFTVECLKRSRDSAQPQKRLQLREDGQEFARPPPPKAHANGDASQANLSGLLIQEAAQHADAKKQLADHQIEFEIARRIQRNLLPPATLVLPGFEVGGVVCPAAAIGGDYFDYVPMPNGACGVVVGDVSGHGAGPALLIASTRAYLRAFAQTSSDLGELLRLADRALSLDTGGEQFVTAILVRLDLQKRSLVYCSAGHPAGYILDVSGHVRIRLPSTGPPLGIASKEGFAESPVIPLRAGELVLLLSDGVAEASAPSGAAFGWMRAVSTVRVYRHDSAVHIAMNLCNAIRDFTQEGPQLDDITAVVIKVTPNNEAPGREPGQRSHGEWDVALRRDKSSHEHPGKEDLPMLTSYPVDCPHANCGWTGSLMPSLLRGGADAEIASMHRAWFRCPRCQGDWEVRITDDRVRVLPAAERSIILRDSVSSKPARAVAFDLETASLASLREALPGWEIDTINGATPVSLARTGDPRAADLVVVSAHGNVVETLALCRFLSLGTEHPGEARKEGAETLAQRPNFPALQPHAPLLVLVPAEQKTLVGAALEAGACSCLVLPIHPKDVATMLAHARAGNQPGRHTLNLDRPQIEDRWRDDGGQG